jgi:hypothetical protein
MLGSQIRQWKLSIKGSWIRYQHVKRLVFEPLEHRRARNKVIMLYKITNYLVEVPVHHLIQYTINNTRGSSAYNIRQITTRIYICKYSFSPSTIKMWTTIPPAVRASISLNSFQNVMHTFDVSGFITTH